MTEPVRCEYCNGPLHPFVAYLGAHPICVEERALYRPPTITGQER